MDTHFSSKTEKHKWERFTSTSGYSGAGGREKKEEKHLILKKTIKERGMK